MFKAEGNELNKAFLPYSSSLPEVAHRSLGRSLEHHTSICTLALATSKKILGKKQMFQIGTALTNQEAGEAASSGICSCSTAIRGETGMSQLQVLQRVIKSFA